MPIECKQFNYAGIYFIKNKVTNKYYIGSSNNIKKRFYQYAFLLKRNKCHSPKLQNSFNKHGKDSFEYGLIEKCDIEELKDRENYWIIRYDSVDNGYNCSADTKCSTRGRKLSLDELKRLSERNRERWRTNRESMIKVSKENIKKATAVRKGSKNTPSHNLAISKANKGRKRTSIHKSKQSERMKLNPLNYWLDKQRSEDDRLKMSRSHLGKTGALHPRSKKIYMMDLNENILSEYHGISDAARQLGLNRTSIKNNVLGYSKTCNKKIFKYVSV
jgi:group I intron endonuclease